MHDFVLRDCWDDRNIVHWAIETGEVDAMIEAGETLVSFRYDPIGSFDPSLFEDIDADDQERCANCGEFFSTADLVYKQDYDICAHTECGLGICCQCFRANPLENGKICR